MRVRVRYVDGSEYAVAPDDWTTLPGAGVDVVYLLTASGDRRSGSHSLYWLYPEGDSWVAGEGSVRYDPNPLVEVIVAPDGRMTERTIPYMPDLRLSQVKLGWWRPGEERPDG